MKITKTPPSRRPSSDPPDIISNALKTLISCTEPDIIIHIQLFGTDWPYPRGDLYLWIPVLNRFDDILSSICTEGDFIHMNPIPLLPDRKSLLLAILQFSRLLMENCANRALYASFDHLNNLLCSQDLDILHATLWLLLRPAQRASMQRQLKASFAISHERLTALAQPLTTGDDKLAHIVSDEYIVSNNLADLNFSFYQSNSADKDGYLHIHTPASAITNSGFQLVTQLINTHNVPYPRKPTGTDPSAVLQSIASATGSGLASAPFVQEGSHPAFLLKHKLMIARTLGSGSTRVMREKLATVRVLAIAVFVFILSDEQATFSKIIVRDLVTELADLVPPSTSSGALGFADAWSSWHLNIAALYAIGGIARFKTRLNDVMLSLNASVSHGTLLGSLRRILAFVTTDDPLCIPFEYYDAFQSLIGFLLTQQSSGTSLLNAGLMTLLAQAFDSIPNRIRYATKLVVLVDSAIYGFPSAFTSFNAAGGLTKLVDRIALETNKANLASLTLTNCWASVQWIKSLLKLMYHMYQTVNGPEMRNLIDSSLPTSLANVFDRLDLVSLSAPAINIMATLIHAEPTCLAILQEAKITQQLLDALGSPPSDTNTCCIPPNSEFILTLPNLFTALALNAPGLAYFTESKALDSFVALLTSSKHMWVLSEAETVQAVGIGVDELLRHQPSIKSRVLDAVVHALGALPNQALVSTTCPDSEANQNNQGLPILVCKNEPAPEVTDVAVSDIVVLVDGVSKFLEGLMQSASHVREFIARDGIAKLIALYFIPGLPTTFPTSNASYSLSHLFRTMANSDTRAVCRIVIKEAVQCMGKWAPVDNLVHRAVFPSSAAEITDLKPALEHLVQLQGLVGLLSDVYSPLTFHSRELSAYIEEALVNLTNPIPSLDDIELPTSLPSYSETRGGGLRAMAYLHVYVMRQLIILRSIVPARHFNELKPSRALGTLLESWSVPSLDKVIPITPETESTDVECGVRYNVKVVRGILHELHTCLVPLMHSVSRMAVCKRSSDAKNKALCREFGCAIVHALHIYFEPMATAGFDGSQRHLYMQQAQAMVTIVLLDERAAATLQSTVAYYALRSSFLHKLCPDLGSAAQTQLEATTELASTRLPDPVRWDMYACMLQFLATAKHITDSDSALQGIKDFEAPHLVVSARIFVLSAILGKSNNDGQQPPIDFTRIPPSSSKMLLKALQAILKADGETARRSAFAGSISENPPAGLLSALFGSLADASNGVEMTPPPEDLLSVLQRFTANGGSGRNQASARIQADPLAIPMLVEMGFSEAVAREALVRNRNDVERAAEYILMNPHLHFQIEEQQVNRAVASSSSTVIAADTESPANAAQQSLSPVPDAPPASSTLEGSNPEASSSGAAAERAPSTDPDLDTAEAVPEAASLPTASQSQESGGSETGDSDNYEDIDDEEEEENADPMEVDVPVATLPSSTITYFSTEETCFLKPDELYTKVKELRNVIQSDAMDVILSLLTAHEDMMHDVRDLISMLPEEKGILDLILRIKKYASNNLEPQPIPAHIILSLIAIASGETGKQKATLKHLFEDIDSLIKIFYRPVDADTENLDAQRRDREWLALLLIFELVLSAATEPVSVEMPKIVGDSIKSFDPASNALRDKALTVFSTDACNHMISTLVKWLKSVPLPSSPSPTAPAGSVPCIPVSSGTSAAANVVQARSETDGSIMVLDTAPELSVIAQNTTGEASTTLPIVALPSSEEEAKKRHTRSTADAVLRMLVRLTKDHGGCQTFVNEAGNPVELLSRFDSIHMSVLLMRHMIEFAHSQMLRCTVDTEIHDAIMKMPHIHSRANAISKGPLEFDALSIVKACPHVILRDPQVFLEEMKHMCIVAHYDPNSRYLMLKLREDHAAHMASLPGAPYVIHMGMESLISTVMSLKDQTDEDAMNHVHSKRTFCLKIISELVLSYTPCKMALMDATRRRSTGPHTPAKSLGVPTATPKSAFVTYLVDELLPWPGVYTSGDMSASVRKKLFESQWASTVLSCLCSNPEPDYTERDASNPIHAARRMVIDAIHRAMAHEPSGIEARYGRYLALSDTIYRILSWPRKRKPTQQSTFPPMQQSGQPEAVPVPLVRNLLDSHFVSQLTNLLGKVDTHHPQSKLIVSSILKPIELLAKLSVKMSSMKSSTSPSDTTSATVVIAETPTQGSSSSQNENRPPEVEDIFRHSSLAIRGGGVVANDNMDLDDESDGDSEDNDSMDSMDDEGTGGYDESSDINQSDADDDDMDDGELDNMEIVIQSNPPHELIAEHEDESRQQDGSCSHHTHDSEDSDSSSIMDAMDVDNEDDSDDGLEGSGVVANVDNSESSHSSTTHEAENDSDMYEDMDSNPEYYSNEDGVGQAILTNDGGVIEYDFNLPLGDLAGMVMPAGLERVIEQLQQGDINMTQSDDQDDMDIYDDEMEGDEDDDEEEMMDHIHAGDGNDHDGIPVFRSHTSQSGGPRDNLGLFARHFGRDMPGSRRMMDLDRSRSSLPNSVPDLTHPMLTSQSTSTRGPVHAVSTIVTQGPNGSMGIIPMSGNLNSLNRLLSTLGHQASSIIQRLATVGHPGQVLDITVNDLSGEYGMPGTRIKVQSNNDPIVNDFKPLSTQDRWMTEARLVNGTTTSERASRILPLLTLEKLPEALEMKRAKEAQEKKKREETKRIEEEEAAAQAAKQSDDITEERSIDEQEQDVFHPATEEIIPDPPGERSVPETQIPVEEPTTEQEPNPAPSSSGSADVPFMLEVDGEMVDLTNYGIDPTFLEALPDDLRTDVIRQHLVEVRRTERAAATASSSAPRPPIPTVISGSSGLLENLPAEFLDVLSPDIREGLQQLAGGPAAHPTSPPPDQPAFLVRRQAQANDNANNAGSNTTNPTAPVVRKDSINLLDRAHVSTLIGLLFTETPIAKSNIIKLLGTLCENARSRKDILSILVHVLIDGLTSVQFRVQSRDNLSSSQVEERCYEILLELVKLGPHISQYFVVSSSEKIPKSPALIHLIDQLNRTHFVDSAVELLSLITPALDIPIPSPTLAKSTPVSPSMAASNVATVSQADSSIPTTISTTTAPQLPPQLPVLKLSPESIRSLLLVLAGECSIKTFQFLLVVLQHLATGDRYDTISSELLSLLSTMANDLTAHVNNLSASLKENSSQVESLLNTFSQPACLQALLLRLLKTIDVFTSKLEKEPPVLSLDEVWTALCHCLEAMSGRDELVSVLLPLIESFMVVEAKAHTHRFTEFTETYKRELNVLVRNNPSLLSGSFSVLVQNPKVLEFDNKRTYFYQQLHGQKPRRSYHGTIHVNVRRSHVFEDSYHQLQHRSGDELKFGRLNVTFNNEDAIDAGGVGREWYSVLARQIFNAGYALFITSTGDKATYQPNRASWVNPDHLHFFRFVGRFIGKAIFDKQLIDCYFTRSFYKHILNKTLDVRDMEAVDPSYYKSLEWILENSIEEIMDLTFSIETDDFGMTKVIDLMENGQNIQVTNENKHKYVQLIVEQKLSSAIQEQLKSFIAGFYEIIPRPLVLIFNEQELELLISGMPVIDIDDWRNNTVYMNYTSTSPVIQWFWRAVRSFGQEQRAKLVQFITGTSKVPMEGFKALQGSGGVNKFTIVKDFGSINRLPSAHTCFNQLDLPEYQSYERVQWNLLKVINEASEGFGFA